MYNMLRNVIRKEIIMLAKRIIHGILAVIAVVIFFGEIVDTHIGLAIMLKVLALAYIGILIYVNFYRRKEN